MTLTSVSTAVCVCVCVLDLLLLCVGVQRDVLFRKYHWENEQSAHTLQSFISQGMAAPIKTHAKSMQEPHLCPKTKHSSSNPTLFRHTKKQQTHRTDFTSV